MPYWENELFIARITKNGSFAKSKELTGRYPAALIQNKPETIEVICRECKNSWEFCEYQCSKKSKLELKCNKCGNSSSVENIKYKI